MIKEYPLALTSSSLLLTDLLTPGVDISKRTAKEDILAPNSLRAQRQIRLHPIAPGSASDRHRCRIPFFFRCPCTWCDGGTQESRFV